MRRIAFLGSMIALLWLPSLMAQAAGESINPFANNYLSLELARNYPAAFTQNRFEPGSYHPVFDFRHNLSSDWMMGVGAQFKIFRRIDLPDQEEPSQDLALWTVTHEALYVLRLDHPTYLFVGPKLHYLLPTRAAKLPVVRDDQLDIQFGAAASMTIARILKSGGMITLRADRWRGTDNMKLHGVEIAAGYSQPLQ